MDGEQRTSGKGSFVKAQGDWLGSLGIYAGAVECIGRTCNIRIAKVNTPQTFGKAAPKMHCATARSIAVACECFIGFGASTP